MKLRKMNSPRTVSEERHNRVRDKVIRYYEWTEEELTTAIELYRQNYSIKGIGTILGRTPQAVRIRIERYLNKRKNENKKTPVA